MRFLRELLGLSKPSGRKGGSRASRSGDPPPMEISEEAFLADPQRFLIHSRTEGQVFVRDRRGDVSLILGTTGIHHEIPADDDSAALFDEEQEGPGVPGTSWLD